MQLAWMYWNPVQEAFTIPFVDLPIAWYGIIFAAGFIAAYFLFIPIFQQFLYRRKELSACEVSHWQALASQFKASARCLDQLPCTLHAALEAAITGADPTPELKKAMLAVLSASFSRKSMEEQFPNSIVPTRRLSLQFADTLAWFIVIGTVVGARLGHVFFYDWPHIKHHLLEIVMIRNGGLASHGGTLGVLIGIWLFLYWNKHKFPCPSFVQLVDLLCIPTGLVAAAIRLGNFFNQEILGVQSSVPWAVIFGAPADGSAPVPRHPVQLYEAGIYLMTFGLLYFLWNRKADLKVGTLSGIFFILIFGARSLIEFLKMPQSMLINESTFQMGQYLSIPFILLGLLLLKWTQWTSRIRA